MALLHGTLNFLPVATKWEQILYALISLMEQESYYLTVGKGNTNSTVAKLALWNM